MELDIRTVVQLAWCANRVKVEAGLSAFEFTGIEILLILRPSELMFIFLPRKILFLPIGKKASRIG